jgi:long-chain fatty acid transport protein
MRKTILLLHALTLVFISPSAHATEGYFLEGVSAREKAIGGAGVADSRDALSIANNPAGLAAVAKQAWTSIRPFSRSVTGGASGL